MWCMELPPRARRIRDGGFRCPRNSGTTSACAENTRSSTPAATRRRNYLRVRGEYRWWFLPQLLFGELPPRARRIQHCRCALLEHLGTTSACAENTQPATSHAKPHRNYLRVRGEYSVADVRFLKASELPPRARRIHVVLRHVECSVGTTSACAENT